MLNNGSNSSTGLINDLDAGIDLWPIGVVNDNQVYRPLDIVSLKKELENKSEEITAKYPDKKKGTGEINIRVRYFR